MRGKLLKERMPKAEGHRILEGEEKNLTLIGDLPKS